MRNLILTPGRLLALALACLWLPSASAQQEPADKPTPKEAAAAEEDSAVTKDLKALRDKINEKLRAGRDREEDFEGELKEFDVLLARHKAGPPDDVVTIPMVKALFYVKVLRAPAKAIPVFERIKADFPATEPGKHADEAIASLKEMIQAQEMEKRLAVGNKWPDFEHKDLEGVATSAARFKGKVVLIDFWATWCGPCVAEMPHLKRVYKNYHDKGFEIIGISRDQDEATLRTFLSRQGIQWPQCHDATDALARQYFLRVIPTNYLLNRDGVIVATQLHGPDVELEVARLLD